jgi:hypothetical protein
MSITAPTRQPSVATRRFGYLLGAAINLALAYAVNIWPGWEAVPFLTEETQQVVGLVTFSMLVAVVVNLVYVAADPPWLKALGDTVTTGIAFAVLVRMLQVFPFDFTGSSFDWALVARVVLVVALIGTAIALVVQFVTLPRRLGERST